MSFISVPTWPSKQSPGEGSLSRGYATLFFRSTSFRHPHPKHVSESSSHPVLTFSAAVVSLGGFSWGAPARLGSSFGILSRKVARCENVSFSPMGNKNNHNKEKRRKEAERRKNKRNVQLNKDLSLKVPTTSESG